MSSLKFNHLAQVAADLEHKGDEYTHDLAQFMFDTAVANAPRRTGDYVAHFHLAEIDGGTALVNDSDHADEVEFGTIHMPPHATMSNAVEETRAHAPDIARRVYR